MATLDTCVDPTNCNKKDVSQPLLSDGPSVTTVHASSGLPANSAITLPSTQPTSPSVLHVFGTGFCEKLTCANRSPCAEHKDQVFLSNAQFQNKAVEYNEGGKNPLYAAIMHPQTYQHRSTQQQRQIVTFAAANIAAKVVPTDLEWLGNIVNMSKLDEVFSAALGPPAEWLQATVFDNFYQGCNLDFEYANLPWSGQVKQRIRKKTFLGQREWMELNISLPTDGLLLLKPELLKLKSIAKNTEYHSKFGANPEWTQVGVAEIRLFCPTVFKFVMNFFQKHAGNGKLTALFHMTSEFQAIDLEFYHAVSGSILSIQFECSVPEGRRKEEWLTELEWE